MGPTRAAEHGIAVSAGPISARLRSLAHRHLERWGLVEAAVLDRAAERLADAVLADGVGPNDDALPDRMRALAERWIADFAGGSSDPKRHWIWHAGALLGRFPRAFLETPLPRSAASAEAGCIAVLPERDPAVIRQQVIAGPLEHLVTTLRQVARRARSGVLDEEPQTLPDPAG